MSENDRLDNLVVMLEERANRIDQEAKLKDYREKWWMEREARSIRMIRGEILSALKK